MVLAAINKVKAGISICVFPEGTRNNTTDDFLPFHSGSLKIAEKSGCAIVPIYPKDLPKEERRKLTDIVINTIKETYYKNQELV